MPETAKIQVHEETAFRGMVDGRWVYGSHVKTGTGMHYIIPQNVIANEIPQHLVDKQTIGQNTGLKDKNGREIYDGDFLMNDSGNVGLVNWVEESAQFLVIFDGYSNEILGAEDWAQ